MSFGGFGVRLLGQVGSVNATILPAGSRTESAVELWLENAARQIDDHSQEHLRGRVLLWLAVLHDPLLADTRDELAEHNVLSPDSLLAVHNRLVAFTPSEADSYVSELMALFETAKEAIRTALMSRLGDTRREGFARHAWQVFFAP